MDRDNELEASYEEMAGMVERFQARPKLLVEGEWYLIERVGSISRIFGVDFESDRLELNYLRENSYEVTPVSILRKN